MLAQYYMHYYCKLWTKKKDNKLIKKEKSLDKLHYESIDLKMQTNCDIKW